MIFRGKKKIWKNISKMDNILGIELESFVQEVKNKDCSFERKRKDKEHTIKATEEILALLKKHKTKATFFVVAEVYDWHPDLIKKIKKEGHEIGFHTYSHKKLLNKQILKMELDNSSKFIKEFKPKGFRAPTIYLKEEYFRILAKHGFVYDSSSYGGRIKKYGKILELPVSTYKIVNKKRFPREMTFRLMVNEFPIGSGYVIGLLGYLIAHFIKKLNKKGLPYIMFMHPYQIKKMPISFLERIKTPLMWPYYINRKKVFESLLKNFRFITFEEFIKKNKLL